MASNESASRDDRKALAEECNHLLAEFGRSIARYERGDNSQNAVDAQDAIERRLYALISRLASLPQPAAAVPSSTQDEPVAWMWEVPGEGTKLSLNEPAEYEDALHITPLYAATPSAPPAAEALQAEAQPVAMPQRCWPADHVSLKQVGGRCRLTLEMDTVPTGRHYWVTLSDARGSCSTPAGCAAHGCHGECLKG